MTLKDPITEQEAEAGNYVNLTNPYSVHERAIMEKAVLNLIRAGVDYALVNTPAGIEIWRDRKGFRFNSEEIKKNQSPPEFMERTI